MGQYASRDSTFPAVAAACRQQLSRPQQLRQLQLHFLNKTPFLPFLSRYLQPSLWLTLMRPPTMMLLMYIARPHCRLPPRHFPPSTISLTSFKPSTGKMELLWSKSHPATIARSTAFEAQLTWSFTVTEGRSEFPRAQGYDTSGLRKSTARSRSQHLLRKSQTSSGLIK